MLKIIEGIEFEVTGLDDFTDDEARNYIQYVEANKTEPDPIKSIEVKLCDDGKVDVNYKLQGEKFERIRRITGKRIAVHSQAV